MRYAPPGRSAFLRTVLLKPRGPRHRDMCSDSVHALKTRLRGASKTRSILSTRSAGSVTRLAAAPMIFLLQFISSGGCQVLTEMLQGFGPSLGCTARRIGFDRLGLIHRQPGLAAKFLEFRLRHYFVGVVIQRAGPDDSLRLDDLPEHAVHPMIAPK